MNYLLYGIIGVASFLFLLITVLVITLLKNNKTVYSDDHTAPPRQCPTCGQILEGDWNRCPFCMGSLDNAKKQRSDKMIPHIPHIGYLIVKTGTDRGKVYCIDKNRVAIGSSNQNDIIINDDNISLQHAKIWFDNNKFYIHDLNSKTGTKVNNRFVERRELYDNDLIDLANNFFVFKILD
ncbi:MAG: FHA domain-containing protein [Spirochaetes bacterium]|nr:FHA domain-containing protein [Spirochaetota bacterium]